MRAVKGAAGSSIARSILLEHRSITIFHLHRRTVRKDLFHPALEHDPARRKGGGFLAARRERRLQTSDGLSPQRRNRDRKLRRLMLDRLEPKWIRTRLLEQAVARA